ncbi:hypothetical protein [Rhodococcus sp. T7]|uniref:hypothetical protein n=1 Tax=Rhodococcus sp. T7 TaxID=627444 RepID=UPI00135C6CB5|nr:hypothetical protein [Rhodococcus sp. T7]KAF0964649.1 hypothetical protein MLGJGCBP_02192 [Rhodococcus sp. T7]
MFDTNATVNNISNWANLEVKLPADLAKSLEAYEALRYVETGHEPVIDPTKLKASNVAVEVDKVAGELSVNAQREEAKRRLLAALGGKILREAGAAVPDLVEQLTPEFNTQAAKFKAAVAKLPYELTSEAIVASANPEVLAALGDAKQAGAYLRAVDQWVAGLTQLPAFAGVDVDAQPVLRILAPSTYKSLVNLLTAHNQPGKDELVVQVGAAYLAAARAGVEFRIADPREAAQLREKLEASRPAPKDVRYLDLTR